MRLFIAIPLSNELKAKLEKMRQSLPPGVRKQPAGQMHITLRFLGKTASAKVEIIKERLATVRSATFTLSITGAGAFPERGRPQIIWAGIEKVKALMQLQRKIEEVCVNSGFKAEKRKFMPHITIGKVKKASSQKLKEWLVQHKNWKGGELQVDRFVLYESRPEAGGVGHKALEEFSLYKP